MVGRQSPIPVDAVKRHPTSVMDTKCSVLGSILLHGCCLANIEQNTPSSHCQARAIFRSTSPCQICIYSSTRYLGRVSLPQDYHMDSLSTSVLTRQVTCQGFFACQCRRPETSRVSSESQVSAPNNGDETHTKSFGILRGWISLLCLLD
jgi:hypothetical protein